MRTTPPRSLYVPGICSLSHVIAYNSQIEASTSFLAGSLESSDPNWKSIDEPLRCVGFITQGVSSATNRIYL